MRRKVKITLVEGSTGKKLCLFPSVESIYLWSCALERGEQLQVPGIEELVLEPDGFIEAELRGFEYVWTNGVARRFDYVRLGKAQRTENSSGFMVTIHSGWTCGNLIPMRPFADAEMVAAEVPYGKDKIDLPVLFKDDQTSHDDE